MEIGNLIKKRQLEAMKKQSVRSHHKKAVVKSRKGSLLYHRRRVLKMSIAQLSLLTGINQITLKRWETHGMTPDDKISQIRKYAKVMRLNLAKLVRSIVN